MLNPTISFRHIYILAMLAAVAFMSGCAVITKVREGVSTSLTEAILNHDDLETVKQGAPSYLLLMDSLIRSQPNDPDTLTAGASLYGAYNGIFVDDKERSLRLSQRAYDYGLEGLCLKTRTLCDVATMEFSFFEKKLSRMDHRELPTLFTVASVWAGWVQVRRDDWSAIAHIPKVKAMMMKVLSIDESYHNGEGQMYMGVLESLLPPSAGGNLEKARTHFERAIELSDEKNLMVKVLYAEKYARMIFNKKLHDKLLKEVLNASIIATNLTLTNVIAQNKAQELLDTSSEYFE